MAGHDDRQRMGTLEFAKPRAAWGGEATAFTPSLAREELLEYLGEQLGLGPLHLIEVEHPTAGNRFLDILAETGDGRRVAIENQYGVADHDHLTRGLAYAVSSKCQVLIVIAEDHRPEFVAVADYLNDVAAAAQDDEGIGVCLVQVRAVRRRGDDVWSPEFVMQASPTWPTGTPPRRSRQGLTLERFYEQCAPDWRSTARGLIESWHAPPMRRASFDSQTVVSLYHLTPRRPEAGTCIFQVGDDGKVWLCRGYVRDATGAFASDADTEALDTRIREVFPGVEWTAKGYYLRVERLLEGVLPFTEWLAERLGAV